jgi:hypothetical protein
MRHYLPSENSKLREMQTFNEEQVQAQQVQAVPEQESAQQLAQRHMQGEMQAVSNIDGALETEMVARMAPLVSSGGDSGLNYSPVLDNQHSAASL